MIEKLKTINPYDETEIDMDADSVCGLVYENTPLVLKINELVDVVNSIVSVQEKLIDSRFVVENVQDKFAEQLKWIGCLCELWSGNSKNHRYGILKGIAKNTYKGHKTIHKYQALSMSFEHCEPVKPDDDIIYRGE